MKKIRVVVTTNEERRRAEYVAAHWEEISYSLNGIYFEIEGGDSPEFDAGDSENDPDYIHLYNAIFRDSDDVPKKRGAPAKMEDGKRTNIYLSAESRAIAERVGGGNVSEGIRIALSKAPAIE